MKPCGGGEIQSDLSLVRKKLNQLFDDLFAHDGYGRLEIDMRILKKEQKEIILRYGKEFRHVVDWKKRHGSEMNDQ